MGEFKQFYMEILDNDICFSIDYDDDEEIKTIEEHQ
jgi:hypothetical protein